MKGKKHWEWPFVKNIIPELLGGNKKKGFLFSESIFFELSDPDNKRTIFMQNQIISGQE